MKHLKSYKIFEAYSDDLKNEIERIFLDLEDLEFQFEISDKNYYPDNNNRSYDSICVDISDREKRFFELKDIEEVMIRLQTFLNPPGVPATERFFIDLSIPGEGVYLPYELFKKEFSGEELYLLNIFIYKVS